MVARKTPTTTPRAKPAPKPRHIPRVEKDQVDTDNRRNIPPEYIDAVRRALMLVGSKQDPMTFSKVMWTQAEIELPGRRSGDPKSTIANPHIDGKNVAGIEATIALMHGVKL